MEGELCQGAISSDLVGEHGSKSSTKPPTRSVCFGANTAQGSSQPD